MIETTGVEKSESADKQFNIGLNRAQFQGFKQLFGKNNGPMWGLGATFKVIYSNAKGVETLTKKTFDIIVNVYEKPTTVDIDLYNMIMVALGKAKITKDANIQLPEVADLTPEWLKPVMLKLDKSVNKEYIDFPKYGTDRVLPGDTTTVPGSATTGVNPAQGDDKMKSWKD